jgi:hypothetical protein
MVSKKVFKLLRFQNNQEKVVLGIQGGIIKYHKIQTFKYYKYHNKSWIKNI